LSPLKTRTPRAASDGDEGRPASCPLDPHTEREKAGAWHPTRGTRPRPAPPLGQARLCGVHAQLRDGPGGPGGQGDGSDRGPPDGWKIGPKRQHDLRSVDGKAPLRQKVNDGTRHPRLPTRGKALLPGARVCDDLCLERSSARPFRSRPQRSAPAHCQIWSGMAFKATTSRVEHASCRETQFQAILVRMPARGIAAWMGRHVDLMRQA